MMHIFILNWYFNEYTAGKFNQLVYNYPIRIPERFSLVIRSLLTQEGICFTLKPDFKFLEVKVTISSFSRFLVDLKAACSLFYQLFCYRTLLL